MQSAPSAQRLRCGLAPSSQSQPDPHIGLIYLEKGERQCWGCNGERGEGVEEGEGKWERATEGGGAFGVWGLKKKEKSKPFVFTHTESLPETLDHISDSRLSSSQSHVKD